MRGLEPDLWGGEGEVGLITNGRFNHCASVMKPPEKPLTEGVQGSSGLANRNTVRCQEGGAPETPQGQKLLRAGLFGTSPCVSVHLVIFYPSGCSQSVTASQLLPGALRAATASYQT